MCAKQYSLEEVGVICVTEERNGVRQHPDIATAAVVVRLGPFAVFVCHGQDLIGLSVCMGALVVSICIESWNTYNSPLMWY